MFCFADATGDCLANLLRPGNAVDHAVDDQMTVIDMAVAGLPAAIAAGHCDGDVAEVATRKVIVRTDSAAGYPGSAAALPARNIGFAVVARKNARIHGAICAAIAQPERWQPALTQTGEVRDGAEVAELTELIDLSGPPEGTRLIMRREPLHPGAQTSLFPDLEFRYWGHDTDGDLAPVDADVFIHGARARRGPRPSAQKLRARAVPVQRPRRQPRLARPGLRRSRPGSMVPAALTRRAPRRRRAEDASVESVVDPARTVRRARRRIERVLGCWPTAEALLGAYRASRPSPDRAAATPSATTPWTGRTHTAVNSRRHTNQLTPPKPTPDDPDRERAADPRSARPTLPTDPRE